MLIQSLDAVLQSWPFEPPEHLLGAMSENTIPRISRTISWSQSVFV
jgi:hypothetical protein